jgi:hypothetical protein
VFIGVPERTAGLVRRIGLILAAIISLDSRIPELRQVFSDLSQVTYSYNLADKIRVDKVGEGVRSPNLADAVMIAFQPVSRALETWIKLARHEGSDG